MKIIEDISYSIDDILDQIKETLGFSYIPTNDHQGYIILGTKVKLMISFFEETKGLESATIVFPSSSFDFVSSPSTSDIYLSCIESAGQIVDLINRMLGSGGQDG